MSYCTAVDLLKNVIVLPKEERHFCRHTGLLR